MVKYKIPYFDKKNNSWRVELSSISYLGAPITLNTAEGRGCTMSYQLGEDMNEPIVPSDAKFVIVKHNLALIDVSELKAAGDLDWSVDVYKNNALYWTGYLVPDGIKEFYQSLPYDVELTAVDGFGLLKGKTFRKEIKAWPSQVKEKSLIGHARTILFSSYILNKPLPIRWVGQLERYDEIGPYVDALTQDEYSIDSQGYADFNGNPYSCYYLLSNLLRSKQCRIYQCAGKWRIERIPDVLTGSNSFKEIDNTYDIDTVPLVISGTESHAHQIGVDSMVDDGAYTLNVPGLKSVTATYSDSRPENIVPNGGFDVPDGSPFKWTASSTDVTHALVDSINGRAGYSASFDFPAASSGTNRVEQIYLGSAGVQTDGIPIDTNTLFKRINFGFTLMPINGFPIDNDGYIKWVTDKPFKLRVELESFGSTNRLYVLNENGFWIPKPSGLAPTLVSTNAVYSSFYGGITYTATLSGSPMAGDYLSFGGLNVIPTADSAYGMNNFLSYIGQYLVDTNTDVLFYTVTTSGSNYILTIQTNQPNDYLLPIKLGLSNSERDGSIVFISEDARLGDVIQTNFDRFQGIKLPDFSDDVNHKCCYIRIYFYINQGQRYVLDDVYINVDDVHGVYKHEYADSKFTDSEDYELKISSSENGFFTSNWMTAYDLSQKQSIYRDSSAYLGTLTDHTARAALIRRSKSLELFEGTLLNWDKDFSYIYTIYGLGTKKMLPLSMTYNTELSECQVSILEINVGSLTTVKSYYSSDDKPLSNEIIN